MTSDNKSWEFESHILFYELWEIWLPFMKFSSSSRNECSEGEDEIFGMWTRTPSGKLQLQGKAYFQSSNYESQTHHTYRGWHSACCTMLDKFGYFYSSKKSNYLVQCFSNPQIMDLRLSSEHEGPLCEIYSSPSTNI